MKVKKFTIAFTCDWWMCEIVKHHESVSDARGRGWIVGLNGDYCCRSCRDQARLWRKRSEK